MNFNYRIVRSSIRGLVGIGSGWEIEGLENLPQQGPVIVVANHVSNFDPPILASALNRKVHYMAKEQLFNNFLADKFLRSLGAFPVKRGRGDMGAIRNALKILKDEKVLGLFPEGTRSKTGKLRRAKLGIVLLAIKAKAPILPVGLIGTKQPFNNKVKVNIGQTFTLEEYYNRKLDKPEMREAGKEIMEHIAQLLK